MSVRAQIDFEYLRLQGEERKMKKAALLCLFWIFFICTGIADTLKLPPGLTAIDDRAFMGDTGLTGQIVIPYGVKRIGAYAFAGCTGFTGTPEIPESVEVIEEHAFDGCTGLSGNVYVSGNCLVSDTAFLDEGVTLIKGYETPVADFVYTKDENGVVITGYNGTDTRVFIPSGIDGEEVRSIGESAFSGKTTLRYVSLPSTVERIGKSAFQNTGLTAVRIPSSVKDIGQSSFYACKQLTLLELNEGLESIGETAFRNCQSLEQVILPDSVKKVGYRAFQGCTKLSVVNYPLGLEDADGQVFYGCTSLTKMDIPEGVTTLRGYFLNSSGIESISFPSTLGEIEESALAQCNGIKGIQFPDSVRVIGKRAFYQCKGLEEVHFSENVNSLGTESFAECTALRQIEFNEQIETIGSSVFSGCKGLTRVVLPSSMKTVGSNMFNNCTNITEIVLPDGLETIEAGAFRNCSGITSFILPETLKTINNAAFENCSGLKSITLPAGLEQSGSGIFKGCTSLTTNELPDGMKVIPANLFSNSKLVSVIIPDSVVVIGSSAFKGCTELSDVTFSSSLEAIRESAFRECSSLVRVDLPDSVCVIEQYAFYDCVNLETFHYPVNLGQSGTTLVQYGTFTFGRGIFRNARKLVSIDVPEGVTNVIGGIFLQHEYLETVHLPSTVKMIDVSAFEECKALRNINFPDGLELIGKTAFRRCSSLAVVNLPDSVTEIRPGAFNDCTSLSVFRYPAGLKYADTFVLAGNLDYIFESPIFSKNNAFTSVSIPDGVTSIPRGIFRSAGTLSDIHIPDSVTRIESFAFAELGNLSYIYLSEYLDDIHKTSFKNDPNLVIECEWGTYALNFAQNREIAYKYLSRTGAYRLNGASWPSGTLYKGDPYVFNGYIRSTEQIREVKGTIYRNGALIKEVILAPECLDYALSDEFSLQMNFEELDLGTYTFNLEAQTDTMAETLVETTFTIVPPPLRTNLFSLKLPGGIIERSTQLTGILSGNYPITSLHLWIEDMTMKEAGGTEYLRINVQNNPDSYSVDLSAFDLFSFDLLGMKMHDYRLYIELESHGETRLRTIDFILVDNASGLDDATAQAVINYVKDGNNILIFDPTVDFAGKIIDEWSVIDAGFISITKYKNIIFGNLMSLGKDYNKNIVDAYHDEIISILTELDEEDGKMSILGVPLEDKIPKFNLKDEKLKIYQEALGYVKEVGDIVYDEDSDFVTGDAKAVYAEIKKSLKLQKKIFAGIKNWDEIADQIANMITDYSAQLKILEYVTSVLDTGDQNFKEAVRQVTVEYSWSAGLLLREAWKQFEKKVLSVADTVIEQISYDPALVKLSMFAVKTVDKITGNKDVSDRKWALLNQTSVARQANIAYSRAFKIVESGQFTAEDCLRLIECFRFAKKSCKHVLETEMLLLDWTDEERMAERDQIYNELIRRRIPGAVEL